MTDGGSPSIAEPDYWWYRVRADLLQRTLARFVPEDPVLLDVGSADGPSVGWLRRSGRRVAVDVDPRGLRPGDVCASAMRLPFADDTFDVVAAFDVIEHCTSEERAVAEASRVLRPGGVFLMSVPAYQWAWTSFDDRNHHVRRYTRRRAVQAVERAGFEVLRATYAFCGTFPAFAASRLLDRVKERVRPPRELGPGEVTPLPRTGDWTERVLVSACAVDRRLLPRHDLPFGSSVVVAARAGEAGRP